MSNDKYNLDGHKMQYHPERVAQWLESPESTFPIYVEISPVGYCNHKCTFCAVDYLEYKRIKLDTTHLCNNIMSMALHGVKSVMYAGEGEPLLHPEIGKIIEWTKGNGIDVAVTTNAIPLTPVLSDQIIPCCKWIKVSCNGGDAITYSDIHRCNAVDWSKLWNNIRYAVRLRDKGGHDCAIGVQTLLLPDNAHSLNDLAHMCREVGVDYLVVKPYSQHNLSITDKYSDIYYGEAYTKRLETLMMYVSSKFEIITRKTTMESWNDDNKCYSKCFSVPFFWAYIMASGDLYGCSAFLGDERFCYGNIDGTIFHKLWSGEKRLKAINAMKEFNVDVCRKNCRMNKINQYLWDLKNPNAHKNFI